MPFITVGPPKAQVVEPEWFERTFIFRLNGGGIHAEDGYQYGTLGVHPTLPNEKEQLVSVTHVPSKLSIMRVSTIEDGLKATEMLWAQARDVWKLYDPDEVRAKLPPNIATWIKECNKVKGLVPQ